LVDGEEYADIAWLRSCLQAEKTYVLLLGAGGWKPEQARSVLPNSLKTEIVVTANMREWRHILKLRCSEKAHPQMRQLMMPLLSELKLLLPPLFESV
jgi:thymidylate synthase (FAD)